MLLSYLHIMSAKEKVKKNQSSNEDCFQDLRACDWKFKLPFSLF